MAILSMITLISIVGYKLYTAGCFGNYYIEQEVYKGEPTTWLWHNYQICWSRRHTLNDFNTTTFAADKKLAEDEIGELKKAEALVP